MKHLLKIGIASFAFGLFLVGADTANGQNRQYRREARREYREEVRDARRDYRDDIRDGDNRREARREYRDEVRDARRDYRNTVRRTNNGWYRYYNGRRSFYPYANYYYRNGIFYRRY